MRSPAGPLPPVLVLHNVPLAHDAPVEGGPEPPFLESDAGVLAEAAAVAAALQRLGAAHRVAGVRRLGELPALLAGAPEPIVFNLVEALRGPPADVDLVPAVCRAFGKECTGGDTPCLALTMDKHLTKAALAAAGLPVPAGVVVAPGERLPSARLPAGPLICKPAASDASEGIDSDAVFPGPGAALARAVRRLHERLGQAVVVEQFIEGRELNVSLLQRGGELAVLPLAEIDFTGFGPDRPRIVGYTAKWQEDSFEYAHTRRLIPAPLPERLAARVRALALAAWRACGCRDYARVDMRLSRRGRPFILEINQNPDVAPDAGFAAALKIGRVPYHRFVSDVVRSAAARQAAAAAAAGSASAQAPAPSDRGRAAAGSGRRPAAAPARPRPRPVIRYTIPADRERILALLAGTRFFRPDELEVAAEVLDEALEAGARGHYQSFAVEDEGDVAGWVCLGPTPCTLGAYDIYWLGVAADRQGRGLGQALLRHAEALIRRRGGRLAVIETSGNPTYTPTRGFYLKAGYAEAARIPDFYALGDDRIIYTKIVG